MKTPVKIITSEKWSQDLYVLFEGEPFTSICPDEWIGERYDRKVDLCRESGCEVDFTIDDIKKTMEDEFDGDNEDVDEYWPEHMVLKNYNNEYFRYDYDGWAKHIGQFDSLSECLEFLKY